MWLTFLNGKRLVELEQSLLPVRLLVHGRRREPDRLLESFLVEERVEARAEARELTVALDLERELRLELLDVIDGASRTVDGLERAQVADDALLVDVEHLSVLLDDAPHAGHLEAVDVAPVGEILVPICLVVHSEQVHLEVVGQDELETR